ncbi:MAG: hypothetical protein R3C03_12290 [Pirellulaceae bacterium]
MPTLRTVFYLESSVIVTVVILPIVVVIVLVTISEYARDHLRVDHQKYFLFLDSMESHPITKPNSVLTRVPSQYLIA